MGLLSDFLLSPVGEIGYGAMAELYDQANIKATDQQKLFRGLGEDLRGERNKNNALLTQKLSNFKTAELNFIKKGGKLIFHLTTFHIVDKNNYKIYLKKVV